MTYQLPTQPQLPIPTRDESVERFTIRAHRLLAPAVKDPYERNELIWSQWGKYRGQTAEEAIAAKTFTADKYEQHRNQCVFAEHDAPDSQGVVKHYRLPEMVRIARHCNFRVRDTDGFSPLTDGHTPEPTDPNPKQPDVLGFSGPYRLGMIGREEQRWAVFCDEYHMAGESAKRLKTKPGRSVELWTFANDPTKSHFYPIAALGGEAPRLPLPNRFKRTTGRGGVQVERYTFEAPTVERNDCFAAPAAGAFVSPGGGNTRVKKHEREEPMQADNELVASILEAISSTPQFQFLDQMMAQANGGQQGPAGGPDAGGGVEAFGSPGAPPIPAGDGGGQGPPAAGPQPGAGQPAPEGGGDLADLNDLMIEDEEDPNAQKFGAGAQAQYSAGGGADRGTNTGFVSQQVHAALAAKYGRLHQAHNATVQRIGQMSAQLSSVVRERTDANRAADIHRLAGEFPDFVNVEEELGAVLYSRNSTMDDATFTSHCATIEKYGRQFQIQANTTARDIPFGEVDRGRGRPDDNEKYQAALSGEAVRVFTAEINKGNDEYTYEQALEVATQNVSKAA